jgi:hypothetical protein
LTYEAFMMEYYALLDATRMWWGERQGELLLAALKHELTFWGWVYNSIVDTLALAGHAIGL